MKFREIVTKIIIDDRKLTDYALNLDNPKGKNKALMFQSHLGYTKHDYQRLKEQIEDKVLEGEVEKGILDEYGQRYQIDLEIEGINSELKEIVRTGWTVAQNSKTARLVTLYI